MSATSNQTVLLENLPGIKPIKSVVHLPAFCIFFHAYVITSITDFVPCENKGCWTT